MPAYANPLPKLPVGHVGANRINDPDDLMSRYARKLDAGERAHFGEGIAVANPTGLDFDPHMARRRIRDRSLDQFERSVRAGYLHCSHLGHLRLRLRSIPRDIASISCRAKRTRCSLDLILIIGVRACSALSIHCVEEVVVGLAVLQLVQEKLHRIHRAHRIKNAPQHPHLRQHAALDQ